MKKKTEQLDNFIEQKKDLKTKQILIDYAGTKFRINEVFGDNWFVENLMTGQTFHLTDWEKLKGLKIISGAE